MVRGDDLGKSMSSYLSRRVETKQNIEIHYHTEIRKLSGKRFLEAVEIEKDVGSGEELNETDARVADQVHERKRAKTERDQHKDDAKEQRSLRNFPGVQRLANRREIRFAGHVPY